MHYSRFFHRVFPVQRKQKNWAFYTFAAILLVWGIRYRGIRKLRQQFAIEQERLTMKQAVEQERREAERQHDFDQARIKFLTNLSHEFRTPISLIIGPIEQLQEKENDHRKVEQLTMARRNARRLLNLVNQLLDFRKLEEHELKLNCSTGDIISFTREVVDSFKDMAHRKNINFIFQAELNTFNTSFDKDKVERILFNLLGNAFKFTEKEGTVALRICQEEVSKEILMCVTDTGIGMSADEQRLIFDRFFQGYAHTGVMNQGSGIGLSITKEFVELHGGTITVSSAPGESSSFTVKLPLQHIPCTTENNEPVIDDIENGVVYTSNEPGNPLPDQMLTLLVLRRIKGWNYR